jgi:phytoene dehydrogenase-like protein
VNGQLNRNAAVNEPLDADVIIVGAGLAGLAAAIHCTEANLSVVVVEAADGVGGRVRSDYVNGFILDRGFQVLLTAYPEAKIMLDYRALALKKFTPGSLIRSGGATSRIADPFRAPKTLLETVKSPVGSPIDKARVGVLRMMNQRASVASLWEKPETTTLARLRALKFSSTMIERFFRPFLAGVQLDPTLSTSSRVFDFVFKMLAEGDNALPTNGMGMISEQLAGRVPAGSIRLNTRVAAVAPGSVTLLDQAVLRAKAVVVATEGPQAAKLLGELVVGPGSNSVSCLYFDAPVAPIDEATIMLNGDGAADGPVNNVCVPSNVSSSYAPKGRHLVSVSVIAAHSGADDVALQAAVLTQLRGWFGSQVDAWNHLRTYTIAHAQPAQSPPALANPQRPVALGHGLFVCGDHRDNASINGALESGRRAAEAVIQTVKI